MKDYARLDSGASVVMVSCLDERFPPQNMLDGKDSTFWVTTGMFPQEFVLALEQSVYVSKITTLSMNVKKLAVEKCDRQKPESFEKVFEVELANRGDRLQTEVHQVNFRANFLKFTILSGHAEFAAMNRISVIADTQPAPAGGFSDFGAAAGGYGSPAATDSGYNNSQGNSTTQTGVAGDAPEADSPAKFNKEDADF